MIRTWNLKNFSINTFGWERHLFDINLFLFLSRVSSISKYISYQLCQCSLKFWDIQVVHYDLVYDENATWFFIACVRLYFWLKNMALCFWCCVQHLINVTTCPWFSMATIKLLPKFTFLYPTFVTLTLMARNKAKVFILC